MTPRHEIGHGSSGAHFGSTGIVAYAAGRHGPDGAALLDPAFLPFLAEPHVAGKLVGDLGCGACPWAILAAQNGAIVEAIDHDRGMIEMACSALSRVKGQLRGKITINHLDVAKLPYPAEHFDLALSLNVGCAMNSSTLRAHIQEMFRTLKSGGRAIMTLPHSLDVLFTDGRKDMDALLNDARRVVGELNSLEPARIQQHLLHLTHVLRGTFVVRDGKLVYGQDAELELGEPIWRKLPTLAVPNFAHTLSEYQGYAQNVGFVVQTRELRFADTAQLHNYLQQNQEVHLGSEYARSSPFALLELQKP